MVRIDADTSISEATRVEALKGRRPHTIILLLLLLRLQDLFGVCGILYLMDKSMPVVVRMGPFGCGKLNKLRITRIQ